MAHGHSAWRRIWRVGGLSVWGLGLLLSVFWFSLGAIAHAQGAAPIVVAIEAKSETGGVLAGQPISFTITITNTGEKVYSLDAISWQQIGATTLPGAACNNTVLGDLAPGAVKSYSCTEVAANTTFQQWVRVEGTRADGTLFQVETNTDVVVVLPVSISGRVWHDTDGDGIQASGESGIADVVVRLFSTTRGYITETTTAGVNGAYEFTNMLPDTYLVDFVPSLPGYRFTRQDAGSDDAVDSDASPTTGATASFTLMGGQSKGNVDAGLYEPARVVGAVWEDRDGDGQIDPNEPGVISATLELRDSAGTSTIAITKTNALGVFDFGLLAPGAYQVRLLPPSGYYLLTPTNGTRAITLTGGLVLSNTNFAVARPVLRFLTDTLTLSEGGTATIEVELRDRPSGFGVVTVHVASVDGSALATQDYTPISTTLVFDVGETRKTIQLTAVDDEVAEEEEAFHLSLSSPTNARLEEPATLRLLIEDDDPLPGTPPVPICTADRIQSPDAPETAGEVDVLDLQAAASRLGQAPLYPEQDLDGDGVVELSDIGLLSQTWRLRCDGLELAWAQQTSNQSRQIYLHWRWVTGKNDVTTRFEVLRRIAGSGAFTVVGEAAAVSDVAAFQALVPADIRDIVRNVELADLNLADDQALLDYLTTPQNSARVMALAEAYPDIARAVGLGFLDTSVPDLETVEYYVREKNNASSPLYGPIAVSPFATLKAPANVREGTVYTGPSNLGLAPSARPITATERYQWDAAQLYRRAHGTAFLLWDLPTKPTPKSASANPFQFGGTSVVIAWPENPYVAGYTIYRKGPATGDQWQRVNPLKVADTPSAGYRLIQPGKSTDPVTQGAFFYADRVIDLFGDVAATQPDQVFTTWQYKVCPVDLLGNEGPCSAAVDIPVRDLLPPSPVTDLQVSADAQHTQLTLTWTYTATEQSEPVTFYVMRSRDPVSLTEPAILASQPITDWVDLTPTGLSLGNVVTMTYTYTPPKQGLYWFRVQVRDNAGNWSAPSAPVKGGLYPRQKPPTPAVSDVDRCMANGLQVTFGNLPSQVRQVIVYRSFDPIVDPNAPNVQLIQRIQVLNGQATFTESYQPPIDTWVYYKVEYLDGYGNVSDPATFKARLCAPNRPDAPEVEKGAAQWDPDTLTYQVPLTYTLPPTGVVSRTVRTLRPGSSGLTTGVQIVPTQTVTVRGEPGETVKVEATETNDKGTSPSTVRWVRNVNNFLDTNRHMANLGQPVAVEWVQNATPPAVRVSIPAPADQNIPIPLVALFRKSSAGNWLQVTPVMTPTGIIFYKNITPTLVITDRADLDLGETYDYTVLALSPKTFEVLGYWGPTRLGGYAGGTVLNIASNTLPPAPTLPCATGYDIRPPSFYGPNGEGWWLVPSDTIALADSWSLQVTNFYDYDGSCGGIDLAPDALYGEGQLIDAYGNRFSATFVDIGADMWTGTHLTGTIVVDLNHVVTDTWRLTTEVEKIAFEPTGSQAQIVVSFPENIKVVDPVLVERSNQVRLVVDNLDAWYMFAPLAVDTTVGTPYYVVDENLPWSLHTDSLQFAYDTLALQDPVTVEDRLGYTPPPNGTLPWPDNNLGFLRPGGTQNTGYVGSGVFVDVNGLQGVFDRTNPFTYVTSFPAGVEVTAMGGAQIWITNSQIGLGSVLNQVSARLDYYSEGTDISFMSQKSKLLQVGERTPLRQIIRLDITPSNGDVFIEDGGLFRTPVVVTPTEITWTGAYTVYTAGPGVTMELYATAASFPENGNAIGWMRQATTVPAPVENVWRKLDAYYAPSAKLDPGLNIIGLEAWAACDCFAPATFMDVDLDLYVRRGGVSGNFRINAQSFGEIRNKWGYLVTIKEYNLLFVDNAVVDGQARLDLRLPYPSDVVIPLRFGPDGFDERGCPREGEVEQVQPYVHTYWNFRETPRTARFVEIGGKGSGRNDHVVDYQAKYQQNTGKTTGAQDLPGAILVLRGTITISGLGKTTTQSSEVGRDIEVPAAHDWFPNGDYGDIRLYLQGNNGTHDLPDYFRVSGVPYALSDVKLSRFYSVMMDEASLPDPAGVRTDKALSDLPPEIMDDQGRITGQSLKQCANRNNGRGAGCGFILLDGNGAVVHFGEIDPGGTSSMVSVDDRPVGQWPIVTNVRDGKKSQAPANEQRLRWAYPIANKYLDEYLPFKLMVNDFGGALVGIKPDVPLLPGGEVLKSDLGVVVTVNFTDTQGFRMDFGLFAGYAASQAGIRALAMNRPGKNNAGIAPYTKWDDVKDDAAKWMQKFGYTLGPGKQDDPLDLAKSVWTAWGTDTYTRTFQIIEPKVRALKGKEAYGITGIQSGQVLKQANATLATGMGQVIFEIAGGDFRLVNIKFGTLLDVRTPDSGQGQKTKKANQALLHVDWLTLEINRDGEIVIIGKNVSTSLTGDLDVRADVLLIIGTGVGNERLEGGVTVAQLKMTDVTFRNLGAVFGAGRLNYAPIAYLGLKGEGSFSSGFTVGGALLFGLINPQSKVLREIGFSDLLNSISKDTGGSAGPPQRPFGGVYAQVYGDFPVYDNGCLVKVSAGIELRGWYFAPLDGGLPVWGGFLRGSVTGTAICLVHAKGELTLVVEGVRPNAQSIGKQVCAKTDENCTAFTGQLWVAIGLFACEPQTWRGWDKRWWNDDGCWQAGAFIQLAYIDQPPANTEKWAATFKMDAE